MRRGFTILELLAASLLLSLLVTVLTMIFNQSSIAWRTGMADAADLSEARKQLGTFHDVEDDALPGLGQAGFSAGRNDNREVKYRTVSLFQNWTGEGGLGNNQSARCQGRLYDEISGVSWQSRIQDVRVGAQENLKNANLHSGSAYLVGVWSAGPDRTFDTADDISTLPEKTK